MAERQMFVVSAAVDYKLEGSGIESVNEYPYACNERQIGYGSGEFFAELVIVYIEGAEHYNNGGYAE